MKNYLTGADIRTYLYMAQKDYLETRRIMNDNGVQPTDIIMAQDIMDALDLALALYSPEDKGRYGKNGEASERVLRKLEHGVKWFYWSECFARKSGRSDVGDRTEMKTGAGDWLWSLRHSDWDGIVAEYRHKQTKILWSTEEFRIEATWEQLFDYLEGYNAKGLSTWFKSAVGFNPMTNKAVVRMQEFKTSKRKIAYLQACPWNEG